MNRSREQLTETISSVRRIADNFAQWMHIRHRKYKDYDREPPLRRKYTPLFGPQLTELQRICDWLKERNLPYPNSHEVIREKLLDIEKLLSETDQLVAKHDGDGARWNLEKLDHSLWLLVEQLRGTASDLEENSQEKDGQRSVGSTRDTRQATPETDIMTVNNDRKIEQIDDFCNWTDKLIDYIKHPDESREVSKARVDTLADQVNNLAQKIWPQINSEQNSWPYQPPDNWEYLNRYGEGIFSVQPEHKEQIIARLQQWKERALEEKLNLRKKLNLQKKQETQQIGVHKKGRHAGTKKRTTSTPAGRNIRPVRDQVFISYSHKDKRWLDDLLTHLKPLVRSGSITVWSDEEIEPGSKWFSEIKAALGGAKVAVLLVTPNFLASDFIHEHELTPLLKEADKGNVHIIWIPVRACLYKETPLKDDQAAIDQKKPLANMKAERDKAWVTICEKIKEAVGR